MSLLMKGAFPSLSISHLTMWTTPSTTTQT
jgi:hypothetical protein